jgi:hypothetical protein
VQDWPLLVIDLGRGGEGYLAEHGGQELVSLVHAELLVRLHKESLVIFRADEDGGWLVGKTDGKDRSDGIQTAAEKTLAVFLEFEGVATRGAPDNKGGVGFMYLFLL